jgi:hypothetical protein
LHETNAELKAYQDERDRLIKAYEDARAAPSQDD